MHVHHDQNVSKASRVPEDTFQELSLKDLPEKYTVQTTSKNVQYEDNNRKSTEKQQ